MIKNIRFIILYTIGLMLMAINANTAENKILLKINNEIITSLDILLISLLFTYNSPRV